MEGEQNGVHEQSNTMNNQTQGNTDHVAFHNLLPSHSHSYRRITKSNGRSSSKHYILAYFLRIYVPLPQQETKETALP